MTLLDKEVLYYENPIDLPCETFEEVEALWSVVEKNQKDISYQYNIIAYDNDICIVNFQMKRTILPSNIEQQIDGIFQISLNDDNLCTMFKQWRFTR